MDERVPVCPPAEWGLEVIERLRQLDPVAPGQLCEGYLGWLCAELARHRADVDPDLRDEAADQALFALVRQPEQFDPARGLDVARYLLMAARGDLANLLARERRRDAGRVSFTLVEEAEWDGNEEREEGPAERLAGVLARAGLDATEKAVCDLMVAGERRTEVFSLALGLTHLLPLEQARQVKRIKDRVKKRLEGVGRGA